MLLQKKNTSFRIGLTIAVIMAALALIGYVWTPYDPVAIAGSQKFLPPSLRHLFGTDNFGRDIFSRVMAGMGTTFFISLCTVAIGGAVGTLVGAFTGYFGGVADEVLMLALGVAFIPSFARVVRAEFARHRSMNYVKSARLMGASHLRIIFRHILPNTWDVLLPALVIGFNNAVLAEASMSYLGIGVAPPDISLGYMLSESQSYMIKAPWYVLCTGLVIVLLILGVSMMGDGLEKGGA